VVPRLPAVAAASLQLSVPVMTALGSLAWLHEPLSTTLAAASLLILWEIALTLLPGRTDRDT
jgi:drug/metabolite transporter (DMT)-like permease